MDNPDYTERQIQDALSARSSLPITINWDGDEPERGGTANFEIYFDHNDTDLVVWDHGSTFDIYRRNGPSRYVAAGWADSYDKLADEIISIIEEDIASGKLGEEE